MSSLASHRLSHPSQSALAGQRIRLRLNGMVVRGSLVLGLTIMRSFVRVGDCRTCRGRHPTTARMRKRHQSTHLHSVWPPRHTENACPCRRHRIIGIAGHLRAKRNLRLASVWGDGRARFPIARSLASLGFRLASPPSRANACFNCLCPHLRVNAFVFGQTEWRCAGR